MDNAGAYDTLHRYFVAKIVGGGERGEGGRYFYKRNFLIT